MQYSNQAWQIICHRYHSLCDIKILCFWCQQEFVLQDAWQCHLTKTEILLNTNMYEFETETMRISFEGSFE